MSKILLDVRQTFNGKGSQRVRYRLRIFNGAARAPRANRIAVISDLSNAGTGIADVIEEITAKINDRYAGGKRHSSRVLVIEHVPPRPEFEETFSLVRFGKERPTLKEPKWTPIERADVERMVGQTL